MSMYSIGKRIMDILGALVGIVLFSPIMIITTLYIKIVSPKGPVFADIPQRVGKDGKTFKMYKFRSMIPNAAELLKQDSDLYKQYQENGYKLDPDPRLIPNAEFLRKFSIDELPQFFNILFGTMSLVGPRAYFPFELKEQGERFPETKDEIQEALTVKPGLTGVWQIGGRSKINFTGRVKMDSEYARTRSLLYDFIIILKTPYVVITRKGAI